MKKGSDRPSEQQQFVPLELQQSEVKQEDGSSAGTYTDHDSHMPRKFHKPWRHPLGDV